MRRLLPSVLALAAFLASPLLGEAGESAISPRLHAWGRFDSGSWKVVRVITETLGDGGQVVSTSTTDTRTTLLDIDGDGVTLAVQACVEVAGKRFQAERQVIKQGFHGELASSNVQISEPTDGQLVVEDRKIPCKVYRLESDDAHEKTVTRLYCSDEVPPYVLKRDSVTTASDGKSVVAEIGVEVVALDMPVRVRGETRNGSYVRTVHKNGKGTVTTLAVMLPEVPGGVVSHNCKEVNSHGRVVRRSTLELIDYNADPDHGINRRRSSRRAK
ncbi:MAG: hypothetical protein LLG00_01095 [Planctomycetaceae bacterium]|nr:hypothetical protein [Planctomycetaceae bacterium]